MLQWIDLNGRQDVFNPESPPVRMVRELQGPAQPGVVRAACHISRLRTEKAWSVTKGNHQLGLLKCNKAQRGGQIIEITLDEGFLMGRCNLDSC